MANKPRYYISRLEVKKEVYDMAQAVSQWHATPTTTFFKGDITRIIVAAHEQLPEKAKIKRGK